MFGGFRTYGDLHGQSLEGIATNILAARLKHLVQEGLLTVRADPAHRQRRIYSLTEDAIALVPVLAHLGAWGVSRIPATALTARATALADGGPEMWEDFMAELRERHLGQPMPEGRRPATPRLAEAYAAAGGTGPRAETAD